MLNKLGNGRIYGSQILEAGDENTMLADFHQFVYIYICRYRSKILWLGKLSGLIHLCEASHQV